MLLKFFNLKFRKNFHYFECVVDLYLQFLLVQKTSYIVIIEKGSLKENLKFT